MTKTQKRDVNPRLSLTGSPSSRNKTPHVLHTRVVTGHGGGPDKTILRSARYGDAAHIRVSAAYIHPHTDPSVATIQKDASRLNCPLWTIGESGPLDPRTVANLLGLCRKLNVSIWHGHDYKSNLYGLLLRRWWPMKLVTTVHGWTRHTARTRLYHHIDNWCLSRYDHVIAVNPTLAKHCRAHGVKPNRLTHIPNAIELSDYEPGGSMSAARDHLGVQQDRLVIGTVGRLSAEKGVDRAIQAIAQLRQTWPNVQLHLIGEGPERHALATLARELGVQDIVHFWGWQHQPNHYYQMMDLLLLPSHTEGLPNAALEAMALGVPVAATDVGGIGELLDHGRCGVLLGQDHDTWPSRLGYLLSNAGRRDTLSRLARTRIEQNHTFRHRMERVLGVYRQVLGNTPLTANTSPQARRQTA